MINHIVLFKIKDYPIEKKTAVTDELKIMLEELKGKIDVIRFLEVKLNHEIVSKNYELVLFSHFDSFEDLEKYRIHPEHQKVVKRVAEITDSRAAIDYIL